MTCIPGYANDTLLFQEDDLGLTLDISTDWITFDRGWIGFTLIGNALDYVDRNKSYWIGSIRHESGD